MGGRANLWESSGNKVGLIDPYGKNYNKKTLPKFKKQAFNDDMLEFNSFDYVIDLGLGRSKKVA